MYNLVYEEMIIQREYRHEDCGEYTVLYPLVMKVETKKPN